MSTQNGQMRNVSVKKNAILNITRQICNIILPLVSYPYILRVIGATNMGRYSFGDSVTGMAMVFAQLGITTYAIREGARIRENREKIKDFSAEIFTISLIAMLLSVTVLSVLMVSVPRLNRDITILLILTTNIITRIAGRDWINSIYEDYLYITVRYIVFQVIAIALMFLFVRGPEDYLLYIIFTVVGNSGGNILNVFYTMRYVPLRISRKLNLKKHIKPMLYLFGVTLTIKIYVESDIAVLGFFVSDKEVGVYAIASKVYSIIKALLNAVVTVAIPRLAFYMGNDGHDEYIALSEKLKSVLYTIVFPCVTGLFMEAENVLRLIGGKEYVGGAGALRVLCIALAVAVLANYYSQVALVINRREKVFFIATIISSIVNIALNLIAIPVFGREGAAITTVISECIVLLICRRGARDYIDESKNSDIYKVALGCSAVVVCCVATRAILSNYFIELIAAMLISTVIYVAVEYATGNSFIKENINMYINKWKK